MVLIKKMVVRSPLKPFLKFTDMNTRSVWKSSDEQHSFPSLAKDIPVDGAVAGGGITGITAAYLLSRAGKTVAVLEAPNARR